MACNLEMGVYKYVVISSPAYRIAITDMMSGKSHKSLLNRGEVAEHAGYITAVGDGTWIHGNSVSETLEISGDPEHDIIHLSEHFGVPPEKS